MSLRETPPPNLPRSPGSAPVRSKGDLAGSAFALVAAVALGAVAVRMMLALGGADAAVALASSGAACLALAFAVWWAARHRTIPRSAPAHAAGEEGFRQLADAMPQIVWTTGLDGTHEYLNRRWYDFMGVPEAEATPDAWKTILHPDDLGPSAERWAESLRSGATFEMEVRLKDRRTGGFLWHLVRTVPARDPDGRIVRWYGTSTNIDLQKRAIDELRAARLGLEDRVTARTAELTAINGTLQHEIARRHQVEQRLQLQYTTAQILARSTSLREGIADILEAIRGTMGWDVVEYWQSDPKGGGVQCVEICHGPTPALEEFARRSRPLVFDSAAGLPYQVWEMGRATWVESLATDHTLLRGVSARAAGLNAGLGFPVLSGTSVVGVLNFFGEQFPEPDADTIALLTGIAGQIGQFIRRKRAEEDLTAATGRLQTILDAATEVSVIAATPEGVITVFNVGAERMLGYTAAEMVGKQTPALIHCPEEVRDRGAALSAEMGYPVEGFETFVVHARRGRPEQNEWTYVRKDGTRFPVMLVVTAQRNSAGGLIGFLGIATDISESKRAESAVAAAKESAEAASRAKGEFLAVMSHEIRTPLNGILGMANLVLDTALTPTQREYLDSLRLAAGSLLALVNDLLDFSKIEAGKLDLDPVPFELRGGLADTLRPLAIPAREKGLEVACRVAPAVPDSLVGDFGRLRQILINLIGNAVKFTPRGEVVLEVGLEGPVGEEIDLRFAVRDTGIGIAPAKLETIFAPFEQADGSTTRNYGGTGLGLTISARLARLLGGTIRVESEPGRGSTFSFQVRMGVRRSPLEPARPPAAPPERAGPALRILLAEDNKINQIVMTRTLQNEGHQVVLAENGREALDAVARETFDLVLMDVSMPVMDGLEATRLLRAGERGTGRHLRIVAVTANVVKGDRDACLAAGMDGYLGKPFQMADLRAALRGEARGSPPRESPSFDPAELLHRLDNNRELVKSIVELFHVEGPNQLTAVRVALDAGDAKGVERAAHTLKGAVALLSAPKAAEAVRELRDALDAMGDK
jgi:PAS domain S-box-containing protein